MRMRKTFLLLCLAFVLIAQNAMAEDVTSTYLGNPGFESCTASTSSFTANYGNEDYSSDEWTRGVSEQWARGGVLAYGSNLYCNTSAGVIPDVAWDNDTDNKNALGMGCSWANQLYYLSDTTTWAAGLYTLSVHVYNANSGGTSVGSNLFGFVTTDGATSYYSSTTSFTACEWTTISVSFLLTEETSGQVSVGYKSSGSGSDSNPVLYFDDITIDYCSTVITDSYLTDPGFEQCTAISSSTDTGGSATSGSSYWTGTATATATGAPVTYNSSLYVGYSGCTAPESSWDDDSDNLIAMGMNARWGTSNYVYYTSEEITLPAGTYAIAVHAYNANSSATSVGANYTGFVTSGNTTYYSTNTSFTAGEWIVDYVTFTLESATTGNIRVGYGGASNGASSNPVIYVDDVTIYGPETTTGDEEEEDSLVYDISTDVLSNGGFEDCEAITENISSTATSYVDYADQGWAITRGDNTYGAVVEYESSYTLNSFSAPSEAWDAEEETDNKNALGISSGWSGNIYYDGDTLTLPAGTYRATIHSYNTNSSASTWQSNLTGFVTTDGTTYYADRLNFVSNTWQTCTVEFTLDTAATGFFRVGGQGLQNSSSSSAVVFFDDYTVATDVPSALGYQRVAAEYDGKKGSITVSYSGGWNYTADASLSLSSGAVATVTDTTGTTTIGTATLTALEGDSIGFTADLSNVTLSASTTYIISIPAEVYGYTGTSAMNQAIAYTLTTPTVSLGEPAASLDDEAILNFDGTLTVLYSDAENNYPEGIYTLGMQTGASATLTAGETTVATGTIAALGGDSVGYTVTFSDLSLTAGTTYTITVAKGAYGYGVTSNSGYNAVLNDELSISFTEAIHVQEGQLYTFQQKASRLYMSVNESSSTKYGNIVLSESEYGFTLEEQEDIDSLRLVSESQEYIYHYGSNTWTLGTTTYGNSKYGDGYLNIALVGMRVSNDTVYYKLVRTYGTTEYILATDDTSSGSILYDNKSYASVADRGLWAISEFERTTVDVTVGTTGYATLYYSQYNLQVPDGLTAYTVEVDGSYAILTAISSGIIPAGTGVVLKASETPTGSTTYSFSVSSNDATAIENNALVGTDVTEKIDEDGYVYYILSTDDEGTVGFYWQSGTGGEYVTNAAHKASLAVEASSDDDEESDDSSVKGLTIVFDDATGILSTVADEARTIQGIYTLTGVKVADGSDVDALPAGIYIINGKKALIK